jgi:hypothetical protein
MAGYGDPDAVPIALKQAVALWVTFFSMHRGDDLSQGTPAGYESLIQPYQLVGVG